MPDQEPSGSPALDLIQMMSGYRTTQVIYVAAQLGIADLLEDGPQDIEQLATSTVSDTRSLLSVMRALATLGLFQETSEGVFAITSLGMPLRSSDNDSVRATALSWGDETSWKTWGDLLFTVKTGKPAFHNVFGVHPFEYVSNSNIFGDTLSQAMAGGADRISHDILQGYDFSNMTKIVDVGGGLGSLATAILQQYPSMEATVFDRPEVAEAARKNIESKGISDRCNVVGGSFFDFIPDGGDGYILCRTIHDWGDDEAISILSHCRSAMRMDAKLIVAEAMVRSAGEPRPSTISEVNMILMGGSERTASEFRSLFDTAGFQISSITPIGSGLSIIEGYPI